MFGNLGYYFGYELITANHMCDLVQARTHKKSRINKKWRKRYGMREVPWNKFLIIDRKICCHPKMIEKLKKGIKVYEVKWE